MKRKDIKTPPFVAPNTDHVPDDSISRREIYRCIERIAGMTVPQYKADCMGDAELQPNPNPSESYAHVLKAVLAYPSFTPRGGNERT